MRALEATVPLVLPIAGGAVGALVASMAGPALAPAALGLALGTTFLVARSARGAKRLNLLLAFAAVLVLVLVAVLAEPTPIVRMTRDELHAAFRKDAELYESLDRGIEASLTHLEQAGVPPAGGVLSADQEIMLVESWRALVDQAVAMDALRRYYDHYYLLDVSEHRAEHAFAFLLTFAADLSLYHAGSRFAQRVLQNDNAAKFLDAPHEGTPAGSFSRFREDLLSGSDALRIAAGEAYLVTIDPGPLADRAAPLLERIQKHLVAVDDLPKLDRTEQTYRAELQRLKRTAVGLWYPVQKRAAELLGDTRVRRPGRYLIARAMRDYVDERLEPGDILLSRKNWYLSNVGLPGFWPHAMLYLGDPKKLDSYFEDEEARAWLGDKRSMSALLAERYPNAWSAYVADGHGEPHRVIEAISEGVVFSTLEHCAGDYFAAMRPRLSKTDKANAIAFAFAQHEKPYDFDFDFATDHALVCTELVWRSYRPAKERNHAIDFSLVPVAGRMTLPANELALKYAREAGTAAAQLDFVVFVDAREDLGEAFVSSEEAFRASAQRTKWDIAQE